jgi:hypothetical protein
MGPNVLAQKEVVPSEYSPPHYLTKGLVACLRKEIFSGTVVITSVTCIPKKIKKQIDIKMITQ